MKKLLVVAFLMLVQVVSSQEVTKNPGDFSSLRVYDRLNVKLIKGTEPKVVITGTRAEDVELVNKGGSLKIRMKLSKLLQGEDVTVVVYYQNIDEIEASEGSYISSEDVFTITSLYLNAKEGAKIKLNLDVQKLKSKFNTGGEAELTGKASVHSTTITSGGIIKARALTTLQTDIVINAGGDADIFAKDFVDAQVRAGGTIDVYGNPAQVNKRTAAGGRITVRK